MANILPNAETQFVDSNGVPYAFGKVYFYVPNTSTPKDTWQDLGQTTLNTNPVTLDAAGRALIWGSGSYRQVLEDQNSNVIWDKVTSDIATGVFAALAAPTGATLIGTADGNVQSDITALQGQVAGLGVSPFTPTQNAPAAMNILVSAGSFVIGAGKSPVTQNQQTSSTITAPVTNPRIDRVVIDGFTGVISVVTGAENVSPVAPAIPAGKFPCARILLQTSTTSILNAQITDERAPSRNFLQSQSNKSSTYTVVQSDLNQLLNFTGASNVVWTLTAPATIASEFSCVVKNAGTAGAIVTLTPASGTIDGGPSLALNPGDIRVLLCDGSNYTTYILSTGSGGSLISVQYITTTQTVNAVVGASNYDVIAVAGGSAGGGVASASAAGGGGPSGIARKFISAASWGASQNITIGAKGTGVSGADGNTGGTTTVGAILTATAGGPGKLDGTQGAQGTATGGDTNGCGSAGTPTYNPGGGVVVYSGGGSSSPYGIGGAAKINSSNSAGANASGYGATGSGAATNAGGSRAGGDGTPGVVIITAYT